MDRFAIHKSLLMHLLILRLAGNNSPSNGTQVHADEMPADLVPAQCTERMEMIKTIVGLVNLDGRPLLPHLALTLPDSLAASASTRSSARAT